MEEKRKLSTGVIILILTLIVALTVVTTILIYKEINSKNNDTNNPTQNNETLQTDVKNNINNSEQLNQTENKEENTNQLNNDINNQANITNKENIVSSTTKTMKLNEKMCSIELECLNTTENTQGIYSNYKIKVNNTKLQIQGEQYERYKEHQISTLTDEETKKEYIILKIDALDGNDINSGAKYLNTTYYIINENAQIIDKIHLSGYDGWIIDDRDDTNHELRCTTYIEQQAHVGSIVTYEYTEATKIYRCKYTMKNGKLSRKITRTYNQDEFDIAGRTI